MKWLARFVGALLLLLAAILLSVGYLYVDLGDAPAFDSSDDPSRPWGVASIGLGLVALLAGAAVVWRRGTEPTDERKPSEHREAP